jgi:mRNA interferase MazF
VLLVSSAIVEAPLLRVTIPPTVANGLRQPSQIMIDKAMTIMRTKIGETFGRLDAWRRHSIKPQRALSLKRRNRSG